MILSLILWIVKRSLAIDIYCKENETFLDRCLRILNGFMPRPSPLNVPIFWFLIIAFLSVFGSVLFADSFSSFFRKTMEWFIVYFLIIEVFLEKKHFKTLLIVFLVTLLATCLDGLYQYYISYKDVFVGHSIVPGDRLTAAFKTPNGLGGFLTIGFPVSLALIFQARSSVLRKILFVLAVFLVLWVFFLTKCRGALIGSFLGLSIFFIFANIRKRSLIVFLFMAFSMVFVCLFFFDRVKLFSPERVDSLSWRWQAWQSVLLMIQERPFFGHGINTFMRLFEFYRPQTSYDPTYAHNCFLQLTAETGVLGLVSFVFVIARFFSVSASTISLAVRHKIGYFYFGILAGLTAFLVHSFVDTNLYSLQLSILFWYTVGVLMALNSSLSTQQQGW